MSVHFWHLNVWDTVVVLEEGKHPTHVYLCATFWYHEGI